MSSKLTGKKKIVVDESAFRDLERSAEEDQILLETNYRSNVFLQYPGTDSVRVGLGKYWDYKVLQYERETYSEGSFSNEHNPAKIFCGAPLNLDYCEEEPFIYKDENDYPVQRHRLVLSCEPTIQSIATNFKFVYPNDNTYTLLQQYGTHNFFWAYLMKYGVKTPAGQTYAPIIKTNQFFVDHYHETFSPYTPLELQNQTPAGKAFFAEYKTYYNSRSPSNIDKIAAHETSVLSNNSAQISYENFISSDAIQNCLPNIYGFLKLANSPAVSSDQVFDIGEIVFGGENKNNQHAPVKIIDYLLNKHNAPNSSNSFAADVLFDRVKNDVYLNLFKYYPLESSLLLYGAMALQPYDYSEGIFSIKKFSNLSQEDAAALNTIEYKYNYSAIEKPFINSILKKGKNIDSNSIFRNWFNSFQYLLQNNPCFHFEFSENSADPASNRYGLKPINKIGALEYSNSILAFSPYAYSSILNKTDQYKFFFPMHFELNFTSEINTEIGDAIKEFYASKFFMKEISRTFRPYGFLEDQSEYISQAENRRFNFDKSQNYNFVDYIEKKVYENISPDPQFLSIPVLQEDSPYFSNTKKIINFVDLSKEWVSGESDETPQTTTTDGINTGGGPAGTTHNRSFDDQTSTWNMDVRNYFSYVRDDKNEPVDMDSDINIIMKSLYGPLFLSKIKNKYNEVKRSYKDILEGAQAYTEDLFYVIKKFRNSDSGLANVQNIIIPNTSEVDIINYVDTQVKYGADATYQYDVFCYRLVFGSKYKYSFIQGSEDPTGLPSGESDGSEVLLQSIDSIIDSEGSEANLIDGFLLQNLPADNGGWSVGLNDYPENDKSKFTATINVDVFPSIQLIEDKIFSTPTITILDNPPVPPNVNIVPYRAVNNRIKILLNSQTDTYRQDPVTILNNDGLVFDQILQSQFSVDGKIRFSSDDTVSNYEVFRLEHRPSNYSDFMPHPSQPTAQGNFAVFDDIIFPNKKYYYTFRSVDIHGHFSNPSSVYEVELIDEKGAVKPIIKTINLEPISNKMTTREVQKYLQIKPNIKQLYFPDSENVNSIFSEKNEQKNKKYKMRLTSKKTGKQIDINFSFAQKQVD